MAKTVAEKHSEAKPVIAVNETEIKAQLGELVRQSVEETLNGLLEAEAERLCQAGPVTRYRRHHVPVPVHHAPLPLRGGIDFRHRGDQP